MDCCQWLLFLSLCILSRTYTFINVKSYYSSHGLLSVAVVPLSLHRNTHTHIYQCERLLFLPWIAVSGCCSSLFAYKNAHTHLSMSTFAIPPMDCCQWLLFLSFCIRSRTYTFIINYNRRCRWLVGWLVGLCQVSGGCTTLHAAKRCPACASKLAARSAAWFSCTVKGNLTLTPSNSPSSSSLSSRS